MAKLSGKSTTVPHANDRASDYSVASSTGQTASAGCSAGVKEMPASEKNAGIWEVRVVCSAFQIGVIC